MDSDKPNGINKPNRTGARIDALSELFDFMCVHSYVSIQLVVGTCYVVSTRVSIVDVHFTQLLLVDSIGPCVLILASDNEGHEAGQKVRSSTGAGHESHESHESHEEGKPRG